MILIRPSVHCSHDLASKLERHIAGIKEAGRSTRHVHVQACACARTFACRHQASTHDVDDLNFQSTDQQLQLGRPCAPEGEWRQNCVGTNGTHLVVQHGVNPVQACG